MRRNKNLSCMAVCMIVLFGFSSFAFATELKYKPKNPAFGGNPNNSSWLLSTANAQNRFKETTTPLEDFNEQLERQLFYRLSKRIVDTTFGTDDDLQAGQYEVGDYTIDISSGSSGDELDVEIVSADGSSTKIEIPGT